MSNKIGQVKTLLQRAFMFSSNQLCFHCDFTKIKEYSEKNSCLCYFIHKKKYNLLVKTSNRKQQQNEY